MSISTTDQVKRELESRGISIAQWAAANDIAPFVVYQLLAGKAKGTRGESHRAAVLLGLKDGQIVHAEEVKDALRKRGARRAA